MQELATVVWDRLAELGVDWNAGSVTIGDRILATSTHPDLRWELSTAIYELWHSGRAADRTGQTSLRRDRGLESRLAAAVPHRSSRTEAVIRSYSDGQAVVEVGRVRVRVPDDLMPPEGHRVGEQVSLPLPALRPCLTPGFLLVDGSAGATTDTRHILRLYVHITTSEVAPQLFGRALRRLERHPLRYRAKVVSRSKSFPRRDALVIYLGEADLQIVPDLVRELAGAAGVGDDTPGMAYRVAPGICLAWEPSDSRPGWDQMSFGQHRAAAVADGIVRHLSGDQPLQVAVAAALREASIDPARPARNSSSPDFPTIDAVPAASGVGGNG